MNRDAHQDLAKIGDLDSSSDRIKIKEFYSIIGCMIKVMHVDTVFESFYFGYFFMHEGVPI